MKELFFDIYNKVMNFFTNDKELGDNSKDTACNRLKLVLMHDRVKMDPFIMQKMREEMIEVLSKYVEIDKDQLNLDLAGEGDAIALMLNIPVLRAKTTEEIEAYETEMREKLAQELREEIENEKAEDESDETEENNDENSEEVSDEESSDESDESENEITDETDEDNSQTVNSNEDNSKVKIDTMDTFKEFEK